jgi:hypothetical protein
VLDDAQKRAAERRRNMIHEQFTSFLRITDNLIDTTRNTATTHITSFRGTLSLINVPNVGLVQQPRSVFGAFSSVTLINNFERTFDDVALEITKIVSRAASTI